MAWAGKFKNGESFNDLNDQEIEQFASEIDESTIKETAAPTFKLPTSIPAQPESSPFGAKPPIGMDKSSGHTLKDVAYDYYGRPAVAVGEFVRDNPAKSAVAAGTLLTGGTSIPLAAGLAIGAEAIDKFHPFNKDIRSEYESKTRGQNAEELLGAGVWGAVGQKVSNMAGARLAGEEARIATQEADLANVERIIQQNKAREAANALVKKEHAEIAAKYTPTELTPDYAKFIRKQLIAENTANGVPKRIVTNRDVQDRFIQMNKDMRETVAVPHPRELMQPAEVPVVQQTAPYGISPRGVSDNLTNAVLGAGLMSSHGLSGMVLGGLAGGIVRPVSDRLAPTVLKGLQAIPGPALKATKFMSYPLAEGIVAPTVKKIKEELDKDKKGK